MIKAVACVWLLVGLVLLSEAVTYNKAIVVTKEVFDNRERLSQYIKYENYKAYPELIELIVDSVFECSKKYNIPASLLVFVIQVESDFNPQAVSAAGAIGLMQVLPKVWLQPNNPISLHKLGIKDAAELFSPAVNIQAGSYILSYYVQKCNGDYTCALKKYFGGSVNSYVAKIKNAIGTYYLLNVF